MANSIHLEAAIYTAEQTEIKMHQVQAALELLVIEECTVPFITRYRKEKTGGLNEEHLRSIHETYEQYLEREKRRTYILETIEKMEMMTPKLKEQILKAQSLAALEDLYAPYKSKKKTKGQLAVEAGLLPLAELIRKGAQSIVELEVLKDKFINNEKKISTWEEALKGAQSILIESFSHHPEVKETLRERYWKVARINSTQRKGAQEIKEFQKFKDYFEYTCPVSELKDPKASHRFLAMRRGMTKKILKVEIEFESDEAIGIIRKECFPEDGLRTDELLAGCAKKAFTHFIHPSLDLEIKGDLKKTSDESAIDVFGVNLKNLLLQPYLGAKSVLALDPGVRTGCKAAVVDQSGKFLFDTVIYPHEPRNDIQGSKLILEKLIEHYNVQYIAIGNGTYGRETLHFISEHVKFVNEGKVKATLVNEAGASIYSASEIAQKEFPDKDATVRGAISIARRFQDPLAELVKIDPKSIGVGQYQHDVNQSKLKKSLSAVVEDCVNFVGVDLNTASAPLLSYISGIGPSVAENIVKKREETGGFKERRDLLKVSRFSQKVFEQAAGFLRIYKGTHPLDATFIHPESYPLIEAWAKEEGLDLKSLVGNQELVGKLEDDSSFKEKVGEFTHQDITKSLKARAQDPRSEFKSTDFRKDVKSIKDLKPDSWYPGVVTNITNFGAFIDIGIKENGLVHISEMADKFVSNPLEVLKVGQEVKARVLEVDQERSRVALSLKTGEAIQTSRPSSSANGSRKKDPHASHRAQPSPALKNNAFAKLKGFKVK